MIRSDRVRQIAIVIITSGSLAVVGCQSKRDGSDVVAKVNGRKILSSEVDKYYKNRTAGAPKEQQPSGEQATSLKLNILDSLIADEILMQRAQKLGLLASDEEVDNKVNQAKAPYTPDQFNDKLKEQGLTLDDLKREIRRNLTIEKVLTKEVSSKINITDGDISGYYNAHKPEFNLIEPQYHFARILVTSQPNPQVKNVSDKAQNDGDARKKIQVVANRLDSGEDFATVAQRYSEDPETSASGGDLGFTPESSFKNSQDPATQAVLKLKPGQYTGIMPVINPATHQPVGYQIIKLISKEPAGQRELNDPRVQQAIRDQLREHREQLLRTAYLEVVRDEAKVDNYFAEDVLKTAGQK